MPAGGDCKGEACAQRLQGLPSVPLNLLSMPFDGQNPPPPPKKKKGKNMLLLPSCAPLPFTELVIESERE